jgi:hypothetical protein
MKWMKILILLVLFTGLSATVIQAQSVNWGNATNEYKHQLNLNAGWDYGLGFGAGYSYRLRSKMPIVLNATYSFPSGNKLLDDFKTRLGAQVRLLQVGDMAFMAQVHGVFRRYGSSSVRLLNFGSDMSGVIGYYRKKWYAATEVGFDKAIVTHFKHSKTFRENFPTVEDGWYEPATGGNFYYSLQAGYSFGKSDVYIKAGKVLTQDFKTTPTIPFSAQIGYNIKLGKR